MVGVTSNCDWTGEFHSVFQTAVERYRNGSTRSETLFTQADIAFLASIGCKGFELFDFVEDHIRNGEPDYESIFQIASVRRDYFFTVQKGQVSHHTIDRRAIPAKSETIGGISWLPRIIAKAQAKLRGELPPDLMYGCSGDQAFLHNINMDPVDFLKQVWEAEEDSSKIVTAVRNRLKMGGKNSKS